MATVDRFTPARAALARYLGAVQRAVAPRAQSSTMGGAPPAFATMDPSRMIFATAGRTSTDAAYRRHEFLTYQGWYHWPDGWSPKRARDAITMHIKGWPYMSAAIARDLPKYPPIFGALRRRMAPSLRAIWRHQGPDRAPGRYAVEDLRRVWREQWHPIYPDALRTHALMGGQWFHVHWELDVARGVEMPRIKRWPWEACVWRGASPSFPGGWYALTIDSGIVRMVPGDGHWIYMSQGERGHEMGAVIALAQTFVAGELGRRDEAGLSEAAGRAAPYVSLKGGVKVDDEIGLAVQDFVAEFGLTRVGGVLPEGNELKAFEIVSDTDFFKNLTAEQLTYVGLVLLGIPTSLQPGTGGVYQPLGSYSVEESLVDEDFEATTRAWQLGVVRPYCEINGQEFEGDDGEPLIKVIAKKYASEGDEAKAEAERATLLATTVQAQVAVFDVKQPDVDDLATRLHTPSLKLKPKAASPPPGAPALPAPPPLAEKIVANDQQAEAAAAE